MISKDFRWFYWNLIFSPFRILNVIRAGAESQSFIVVLKQTVNYKGLYSWKDLPSKLELNQRVSISTLLFICLNGSESWRQPILAVWSPNSSWIVMTLLKICWTFSKLALVEYPIRKGSRQKLKNQLRGSSWDRFKMCNSVEKTRR